MKVTQLRQMLSDLVMQPSESEWLEFKHTKILFDGYLTTAVFKIIMWLKNNVLLFDAYLIFPLFLSRYSDRQFTEETASVAK